MMNKRRFTMYTKQPKKMIIINILDILKRYTDENHRLSQREIMDILEREYDMKVDRKAVKRNLMNLIDFGYQVEYSESIRQGRAGSKYYNCLRTLVKNAQNAIGSCELIDCAYMNINKRGGYNTADKTRIRNYAKKYEKFIEKEIELLDPEIIICCGILDDQGICKKILKSCGKSVYLYKRHPSRYSKDLCNWEKLEEL